MDIRIKPNFFNELNPIVVIFLYSLLFFLFKYFCIFLILFFSTPSANPSSTSSFGFYVSNFGYAVFSLVFLKNVIAGFSSSKSSNNKGFLIAILFVFLLGFADNMRVPQDMRFSPIVPNLQILISRLVTSPILETIVLCYIFKIVRTKFNDLISIILSSIVFGASHSMLNIKFWSPFIGALIMTYCYYKTKKLVYPIIIHFLHNFSTVFYPIVIARYSLRTSRMISSTLVLLMVLIIVVIWMKEKKRDALQIEKSWQQKLIEK